MQAHTKQNKPPAEVKIDPFVPISELAWREGAEWPKTFSSLKKKFGTFIANERNESFPQIHLE